MANAGYFTPTSGGTWAYNWLLFPLCRSIGQISWWPKFFTAGRKRMAQRCVTKAKGEMTVTSRRGIPVVYLF